MTEQPPDIPYGDDFSAEEDSVRDDLIMRREGLQAAVREKTAAVDGFGRKWILASGIVIASGAVLYVLAGASYDRPYYSQGSSPLVSAELLVSFVFATLTGVLATASVMFRPIVRALSVLASTGLVWGLYSGIGTYESTARGLSYGSAGPEAWLYSILAGLGVMFIAFPVWMTVGLTPFATQLARLTFPKNQFLRQSGFRTGIFWIVIFLITMLIYVGIFLHFYDYYFGNYSYYGLYRTFDKHAVTELIVLLMTFVASIFCFLVPLFALLNTSSSPPERIIRFSKYSVVSGIVGAAVFLTAFLIAVFSDRHVKTHEVFLVIYSCVTGAGFLMLVTVAYTTLLLLNAQKKWRLQVALELDRLEIEINPEPDYEEAPEGETDAGTPPCEPGG